MTRINVIPVTELTDKHLLAEYRELPRVFRAARKWHDGGGSTDDLPSTYRMGKGHVKFFYDKLQFCYLRQCDLYSECKSRGFAVTLRPNREYLMGNAPSTMQRDYTPTRRALLINRERILARLTEAASRNKTTG